MKNITTELGKIYCKYNEKTDSFDKLRVIDIIKEDNGNIAFYLAPLNEKYGFDTDKLNGDMFAESLKVLSAKEYYNLAQEYVLLKSDGIISLTNVRSISNEVRDINDVLLIYFPNHKVTKVPDANNPFVVARQGINNVYAEMAGYLDKVGMSCSIYTLPVGFTLTDLMVNEAVLNSRLAHYYKIDTYDNLNTILCNEATDNILTELFEGRVTYLKNTDHTFKYEPKQDDCIDGYCNSLLRFMKEVEFLSDVRNVAGITEIDFELKSGEPLSIDDTVYLSLLLGGERISKAVPLAFDYDVNMEHISMKYAIVMDTTERLYFVAYTNFDNEIDAEAIYKLTEERTNTIHERLSKCVKTYLDSQNKAD